VYTRCLGALKILSAGRIPHPAPDYSRYSPQAVCCEGFQLDGLSRLDPALHRRRTPAPKGKSVDAGKRAVIMSGTPCLAFNPPHQYAPLTAAKKLGTRKIICWSSDGH